LAEGALNFLVLDVTFIIDSILESTRFTN
jgi:hypothetical protein